MVASLSGTLVPNDPESAIVTGGSTLRITLAGAAFWKSCGAEFDAIKQGLIDGMVAIQNEAQGYNAKVTPVQTTTTIQRHSDRLAVYTLTAVSTYDITVSEVVDVTISNSAFNTEKELHPGSDAGSTGAFFNIFPVLGTCAPVTSTTSPTVVTSTADKNFSTMGQATFTSSTNSPTALTSTAANNFSTLGQATFVTSTS